jgi:hypothetical protein
MQKLEALGEVHRAKCFSAEINARLGKRAEAVRLLAEIATPPSWVGVASTHLVLGDRDQAIRSLEKAVQERDNHLIWLRIDPAFETLRADPRFDAILRQINLL